MAVKAYFVMRSDLNISAAKLAVQVGHGVDFIYSPDSSTKYIGPWFKNNRVKIVLGVKTKEKFDNITATLKEHNTPFTVIVDAGLTELNGPTVTGLVIHPIEEELLPTQIRRLQTYKDK